MKNWDDIMKKQYCKISKKFLLQKYKDLIWLHALSAMYFLTKEHEFGIRNSDEWRIPTFEVRKTDISSKILHKYRTICIFARPLVCGTRYAFVQLENNDLCGDDLSRSVVVQFLKKHEHNMKTCIGVKKDKLTDQQTQTQMRECV